MAFLIFIPNEAGIRATVSVAHSPVGLDIGRRGQRVAEQAKRSTQFNDCTGRLRASINRKRVKSGEGPSVEVKAEANHALVVHEGRGPVQVKNANWLAIRKQCTRGPGRVFAKSVGPAAPRPYLRDALTAAAG